MKRTLISILFAGLIAGPAANAFDLQGHRGARGLAPENTLAAFQTALKIGVATLELDLAMTKDDVLVLRRVHVVAERVRGSPKLGFEGAIAVAAQDDAVVGATPKDIVWTHNLERALDEAKSRQRHVLLDFSAAPM